jgi:hypothetical protein
VLRPHVDHDAAFIAGVAASAATLLGPGVRVVTAPSVAWPAVAPTGGTETDAAGSIRAAGWPRGTIAIVPGPLRTRFLARAGGWTDRRRGVALVSTWELEEGGGRAFDRLVKLVAHEASHVLGMRHCRRPSCLSRPARDIRDLDELTGFCKRCRQRLDPPVTWLPARLARLR